VKLKVEVTLATGRKVPIEHETDAVNYSSDLAKLHEMYGEDNVKEIK
jgi:hypothetical protein